MAELVTFEEYLSQERFGGYNFPYSKFKGMSVRERVRKYNQEGHIEGRVFHESGKPRSMIVKVENEITTFLAFKIQDGSFDEEYDEFREYIESWSKEEFYLKVFPNSDLVKKMREDYFSVMEDPEDDPVGESHKRYHVIKEKPIGIEIRLSNVRSPEAIARLINRTVSKYTKTEVFYTSTNEGLDVYNIKFDEDKSDFRYFRHRANESEKGSITEIYQDLSSKLEEQDVMIKGYNKMSEGSLVYKTREAGRKDGTGRIQRPW